MKTVTALILSLCGDGIVIHESNGLIHAHENGFNEYLNDAILPSLEMKNVNATAHLIAHNESTCSLGENIFLDFLPDDVLETYKLFDIGSCKERIEIYTRFQERADLFIEFTKKIDSFLKSCLFQLSKNISFHTESIQPAGLKSVNYKISEEYRIYTGLHIDRSEYYPIGECKKSKQRLCINLGEKRYLYIFDISIDKLKDLLLDEFQVELTFENLIQEYYKYYKKYPVKVIEMPFGSYYIAPTDNLIHDAGTMDHETFDVTLHYMGEFKLKTNEIYAYY